jgi:hypothetical protein
MTGLGWEYERLIAASGNQPEQRSRTSLQEEVPEEDKRKCLCSTGAHRL